MYFSDHHQYNWSILAKIRNIWYVCCSVTIQHSNGFLLKFHYYRQAPGCLLSRPVKSEWREQQFGGLLGCIRMSHFLFLFFKPVFEHWTGGGNTHKPDRKTVLTFNTSQQCAKLLLSSLRLNMPGCFARTNGWGTFSLCLVVVVVIHILHSNRVLLRGPEREPLREINNVPLAFKGSHLTFRFYYSEIWFGNAAYNLFQSHVINYGGE